MALFLDWAADRQAFFTWLHAGLLFFALLGGAMGFLGYYINIKSDAGVELSNWEWQRSGARVRAATLGDLYARNHKGRSLRQAETRRRFAAGVLLSALMAIVGLGFLQALTDSKDLSWAEAYPLIYSGGGINSEVLASALIFLLPAILVGGRLMFGIARWIRLRRREKSGQWVLRLKNGERACRSLSKVDFMLCLLFLAVLAYPICRAFMAVFGAEGASRLPEAYYDGTLLLWQVAASAAALLWAAVQSVIRAVLVFNNPSFSSH